MKFFDTVKNRCSTRDFSSRALAVGDLDKMLDAGRCAPTARNEQPWEFITVTTRRGMEDIAAITDHGKFIARAAACVAVVSKDTKYYLEDGCAATENILLAAAALGIGSCWVAGDKKVYTGDILKYLGVPDGYKLVSLIALGYPAAGFVYKEKRSLEEVTHREKFNG